MGLVEKWVLEKKVQISDDGAEMSVEYWSKTLLGKLKEVIKMKRLLIALVVCIMLSATFGWAKWHGWVKHTNGEHAAKYTLVTAKHDNPDSSVVVSYTGDGYTLSQTSGGMEPGRYYNLVWARDDGHRGWVGGGTYSPSPWVEKNITLDDSAWPEE